MGKKNIQSDYKKRKCIMDKFLPKDKTRRKEEILFGFWEATEILSRIYDGGTKP